jgi:carbonic anhydrase/acetyltransferase-like protein (isoleucine patch superfamily)
VRCHQLRDGRLCFGEVVIGSGCILEAHAVVSAGTILPAGTLVKGRAPDGVAAAGAAASAAWVAGRAAGAGEVVQGLGIMTTPTSLSPVRHRVPSRATEA